MREEMRETIRRLTEAFGPSGQEERVREMISSQMRPYVDQVRTDALGNLICSRAARGAGGKRVMLAAHMDEIGVMITHVEEKGFLRFSAIGGVTPFVCLGQRVAFARGTVGVVGTEKVDNPKDLRLEKLFIDIGASSREEAVQKVNIGEAGVFPRPLEREGSRLIAKSLDDRIGCAILVEVARLLGDVPHEIHFVFTVQEEVGLRGARTSAYGLAPDLALAVDVTRTGDTPKGDNMEVSLGKGAAIKVKDSSLICHPGVRRLLTETAERHGIPYQLEVLERGGTDAGAIQLTREGVPTGAVSVPARYLHTPCEMVDEGDVEACVVLLLKFLTTPLAWE